MADEKDDKRDDKRKSLRPRRSLPPPPAPTPVNAQTTSPDAMKRRIEDLEKHVAKTMSERDRAVREFTGVEDKADKLKGEVAALQRKLTQVETATLDQICDRVNTVLAKHKLPLMTRAEIATASREKAAVAINAADEVAVDGGWGTTRPPPLRPQTPAPPPSSQRAPETQSYGHTRNRTIGFENLMPRPQPIAEAPPPATPVPPARPVRLRDLRNFKTQPIAVPPPPPFSDNNGKPGSGESER